MTRYWRARLDKIRFRLEQMTLQQRLVLSYVLILLIPSVLVSLYLFRGFTDGAIDDIRLDSEVALEIERVHIQNNMETMKRAAQLTAHDERVQEYLARETEPSASELLAFDDVTVQAILRIHFNNPGIEHIRVFMNNPLTYEIWPVFLHEERVRGEPWHGDALAAGGRDYWAFQRYDREVIRSVSGAPDEEKPKISLFQTIEYPQGDRVGLLEIDMLLANFFPNTFGPLQDEGTATLVVDRDGEVYRPAGHPLLEPTGVAAADLARRFEPYRRSGSESGSFTFEAGGVPFLASYALVAPVDAHLVRLVPLAPVYEEINRMRNRILLANVVLLAILTLATSLLNGLILNKLHALTDSMKKVRQGEFDFDLDIRGGGEVGELAHHFRKMLRKINELIADAVRKQAAAKEAELATLKNQIDSHFLYNTLENIKMMAEIGGQLHISDALTSLGGMMRYNMRWTSEYVRLRDEIAHIGHYVNIANIRFDGQVKLTIDIAERDLDQELLKMTLQPIVENAVKHGWGNRELTIAIRAETRDDAMTIVVCDDGVGMTAEQTEELNRRIALGGPPRTEDRTGDRPAAGGGIGLANVHSRIQMHYGKEYGLHVTSERGRYTRVVVRIPHFLIHGEVT